MGAKFSKHRQRRLLCRSCVRPVECPFLSTKTTYGATVVAGGSSLDPKDAQHTQAELTALAAQVAAGKRTLRDAVVGRGK